jgi:phosphoglycerate dehydrogenase-like enzyme
MEQLRQSQRLRVLFYMRDPQGVWIVPPHLLERLVAEFPEVRIDLPADRAEFERLLPEAEAVVGWAVRAENFASARRLRWIQVFAAGVGTLLFPELVASEVVVTSGRGLHAVAMAEHTLGVMFVFARKLHLARDAQREHRWTQNELFIGATPFRELVGSTLGIVGLGAVGRALAERARALGLTVLVVRRRPAADPAPAHEQSGPEGMHALLARADWLVLAPALTPDTKGMIGRAELARMKPSAVLVNLGRGALVDEPALIEALQAGTIAGAALDVTADEPLPAASPLWDMPNVIVTPHISGLGPRYWERALELFGRNLRHVLAGETLENVVDKRAGY